MNDRNIFRSSLCALHSSLPLRPLARASGLVCDSHVSRLRSLTLPARLPSYPPHPLRIPLSPSLDFFASWRALCEIGGVAKSSLDFGPAGLGYWLLKSRSTTFVNNKSKRSSAEEGARGRCAPGREPPVGTPGPEVTRMLGTDLRAMHAVRGGVPRAA